MHIALNMWRLTVLVLALCSVAASQSSPKTADELVGNVMDNCADTECVKSNVLRYLDNILNIHSDNARSYKNVDAAIFKRVARVFKTHEIRYKLPEMIFGDMEVVYNPRDGLDVNTAENEGRGLLKKKLLFPALLLLKLKMKALMPILVAIVGFKALKALIISKLAILIVVGFLVYQLCMKAGMTMPMMQMAPPMPEPPTSLYGAPGPSTAPPSSYEPGWEPSSQSGPYSRVWTAGQDSQSLAYSAYYPQSSTTTTRP